VDHKISKKDSLFGTYLFDTTDFTQPDSFNNVILKSHTGRQTVVIEANHTFSPNVVMPRELVTAAVMRLTSYPRRH